MVKKICLQLSNLPSLQLIEHQRNIRVGKKTESNTKPGCEWIALPWGYWMVLLIPLSRVISQICLLQRRSGILFIRSMLKTDKALMFMHLWRRSGAWIRMVLSLCLTTLEEWLIFVVRSLKERVPWMIWYLPMLFFAHFLMTMLSGMFSRRLLSKKGQALLYLKQWWAWMAFMIAWLEIRGRLSIWHLLLSHRELWTMVILLERRKSSKRRPLTQNLIIYVTPVVRKVIRV